jgi:DMSO/TMAO reductase YedYZ molybdopterin-dependent catalytic subunit
MTAERRWQFLAGVVAAAVMTAAMVILRLATGVLSLPELLGEGLIRVLPPEVFSRILDTLLRAAKPTLEAGIVIGQLALGGALGLVYARDPGWRRALFIGGATWLLVGLLLLPLLGLGAFGGRPLPIGLSLLASFLVYGAALVWLHRLLLMATVATEAEAPIVTRRSALTTVGVGVAALAVGGYAWRILGEGAGTRTAAPAPPEPGQGPAGSAPPAGAAPDLAPQPAAFSPAPGQPNPAPFDVPALSTEVTTTKDFYTVSKNFFDPNVDVKGWSLKIDGLVERPMTLDYEAIQKLPSVSNFYTLQCISNPVGGDLWGNAYWKGVRLADLLQTAGLKPAIRKVVFHAADDYTDSIVLERALNSGALLAYEMNGAPLTRTHGAPARLLIPNIYGMKNVKWITRIHLVDYDFKGYWMQRGWSDPAPYQVSSRIDAPSNRGTVASGEVPIGGVSFAGDRGIRAVEYSLDEGKSWQPAQVKPALATNTWQLWTARPTLAPGRYTLKVRATDGLGELQTAQEAEPLPDGATGYHAVIMVVA